MTSYAGDVSCQSCWEALSANENAQLIDVRTRAEWSFVGIPNLSSIGKNVILSEWQSFPEMQFNPAFVESVGQQLAQMGIEQDAKLYFLCRSGVRSIAAAQAITASGFVEAYNVVGGFEGGPDQNGHRGNVSGWKFDGLPWQQQ